MVGIAFLSFGLGLTHETMNLPVDEGCPGTGGVVTPQQGQQQWRALEQYSVVRKLQLVS